jgi:hypothetical protein
MAATLPLTPTVGESPIIPSTLPFSTYVPEIPPPPSPGIYYVAINEPGASDDLNGLYPTYAGENNGPWRSIESATRNLKAGETAYIRAGI